MSLSETGVGAQNATSYPLTIDSDGKPPRSGFRLLEQSDRVCRPGLDLISDRVSVHRGAIGNHVFSDIVRGQSPLKRGRAVSPIPRHSRPPARYPIADDR